MSITDMITESPSGGTVSLVDAPLPVTGFFVGGIVPSLVVPAGTDLRQVREIIDEFAEYLRDEVGAEYLGWWTDEETGCVYLDGTTWHWSEFLAGRTGRERHEIAIFDIRNARELRLTYVDGE